MSDNYTEDILKNIAGKKKPTIMGYPVEDLISLAQMIKELGLTPADLKNMVNDCDYILEVIKKYIQRESDNYLIRSILEFLKIGEKGEPSGEPVGIMHDMKASGMDIQKKVDFRYMDMPIRKPIIREVRPKNE